MAGLKNIKLKIQSVKKTSTVTRAMEAVSAVKMRKAQQRALTARPYALSAFRVLRGLSGSVDLLSHPLMTERKEGRIAVLLITSDKGLAGSLNSAVLKKVENFIKGRNLKRDDLIFLCLGKRGYEFAQARGYKVAHRHINISDDIDLEEFEQITKQITTLYNDGIVRDVHAAYTNYVSTFEQRAAMHKILPLSRLIVEHIVADIATPRGKLLDKFEADAVPTYMVEPDASEVFTMLLPLLVNVAIFHKLLESKASEHSARMVAMKSATDKAKEMSQILTRKFNKIRQAAITREVSEITSGIEAMK
ncbi:MAG: F-type H+-transporting ATPase subunit gamma [Parcubacteria group bacterium Gr01-1014_8]|nr:MAG: F-type H+-transporting ATPase subunit gamma [Parcubacteria group bacterium Gr01-1014_8]